MPVVERKTVKKRLKGFEPSTFCMASSFCAWPVCRNWLQMAGFVGTAGLAGLHELR
jgi:hypothetical protein